MNTSHFKEFSLKGLLPYRGEHKKIQRCWHKMSLAHSDTGEKKKNNVPSFRWSRSGSVKALDEYITHGIIKHFCQSPVVNGPSQMVWSIQVCLPGKKDMLGWAPSLGTKEKLLFLKMRESRGPQWFGATPSSRASLTKNQDRATSPPLAEEGEKRGQVICKMSEAEHKHREQCCHGEKGFTKMGKTTQSEKILHRMDT